MIFKSSFLTTGLLAFAALASVQSQTISELASDSPDLTTLATALNLTGLDETLDCNLSFCRFTAFAPTDTAFAGLPDGLLAKLITPDWEAHLTGILKYHYSFGTLESGDIENEGRVFTALGDRVNTTVDEDGNVFINDAQVTTPDVSASNGVVHIVNSVLIPPFMTKDIIATATEAGIFGTLLAALDATSLTSTLQGDGPFTVFAPTDNAFDRLGEGAVEALLDDLPALTEILQYHVIPSEIVLSGELDDDTILTTFQGEDIDVDLRGFWIFKIPVLNDNVHIIVTDILASNGVIHVIRDVLLPSSAVPPEPTIAEIVAARSDLSTLRVALEATGLNETLNGDGPFTLFAPTDDAFDDLGEDTINALLADLPSLSDILLYHVVSGEVQRGDLEDGAVATVNGADIFIDVGFFRVYINTDTRIRNFDIEARNGVIHIITKVLIPPAGDCLAVAEANGLATFVAAVDAVPGLRTQLEDPDATLTLFVPSEEAFASPDLDVPALLNDPGTLGDILLYHAIGTEITSADLSDDAVVETLQGASVTIDLRFAFVIFFLGAFVNDSKIVETDLLCSNGIIHVIDEVLIPPS